MTALLKRHIQTAADILAAAKAGDAAGTQAATTRWHAKADSIAAFLSTANPHNGPLADMKTTMTDHLDLTLAEAVARLHGDYAADIAAYNRVHEVILRMADMLSEEIIRQFPDRIRQVPPSR